MQQREGRWMWLGLLLAGFSCAKSLGVKGDADRNANCPGLGTLDGLAKIDLAKEFTLDAASAAKIKIGLETAAEIVGVGTQIDEDLKAACISITRDLGAKAEYESTAAACKAATKALESVRAHLGPDMLITVAVRPPSCSQSMDAMAECLTGCDPALEGAPADMQCEGADVAGACDGKCAGTCDMAAGGKCDGRCEGGCAGSFVGTCKGKCTGKCAGTSVRGAECAEQCGGKCEGEATGQCKGVCRGDCTFKAPAGCAGQCTGKCSVAFKAPLCAGDIVTPNVSANCRTRCDVQGSTLIACSAATVAITVDGAADSDAAASYQAALESSLPTLIDIAQGMGERFARASAGAQKALKDLRRRVKATKKPARLAACVAGPLQKAVLAAAAIQANVKVSAAVSESASASGGGPGPVRSR